MAQQARGTNRLLAWPDCERSASVRLCARAQPMSARQNAKLSEQTARDLKFQNLRTFRCRVLPLCGSRFCRRKWRRRAETARREPCFSRFYRSERRALSCYVQSSLLSMTTPRGTSPHAFYSKRQGLIIFIGSSGCVKFARRASAAFAQDPLFKPTRVRSSHAKCGLKLTDKLRVVKFRLEF